MVFWSNFWPMNIAFRVLIYLHVWTSFMSITALPSHDFQHVTHKGLFFLMWRSCMLHTYRTEAGAKSHNPRGVLVKKKKKNGTNIKGTLSKEEHMADCAVTRKYCRLGWCDVVQRASKVLLSHQTINPHTVWNTAPRIHKESPDTSPHRLLRSPETTDHANSPPLTTATVMP